MLGRYHLVLDANSKSLCRKIDTRFNSKHGAHGNGFLHVARIMDRSRE